MNRNKQRNMLKMKREIGFHEVPELLSAAPVAFVDPGHELTYVLKVEYSEEGGSHYRIRSQDGRVMVEWRRSQFSRRDWNTHLERLGMMTSDFWLARYHTGTKELTFVRRVRREEW